MGRPIIQTAVALVFAMTAVFAHKLGQDYWTAGLSLGAIQFLLEANKED